MSTPSCADIQARLPVEQNHERIGYHQVLLPARQYVCKADGTVSILPFALIAGILSANVDARAITYSLRLSHQITLHSLHGCVLQGSTGFKALASSPGLLKSPQP